MADYNENEIIKQLCDPKQQREAFGKVVKRYSEPMYWQIRRMVLTHDDANDILQNALLKAWKNISSFHNESKLSTWLYRIATNESLDFLRHKKTYAMTSLDTPAQKDDGSSSTKETNGVAATLKADPYFDGDETQAMLQEAIAKLPDVQRTVFNMRYYDNMKYSEMSKILHTTEGALKASYHIAVKKISEYFHLRD